MNFSTEKVSHLQELVAFVDDTVDWEMSIDATHLVLETLNEEEKKKKKKKKKKTLRDLLQG